MKWRGGADSGSRWLRLWLRAVSVLVPRSRREEWREEWLGEFVAHRGSDGRRPVTGNDALRRALGALPDAIYLGWRDVGMGEWRQEVRFSVRSLLRRPGLTTVAMGTLALAIGAGTILFSVAEAVLLRPLPFNEPDRLVRLWGMRDGARTLGGTISYPNARDVGDRSGTLEAVALFNEWQPAPALGGGDGPPVVVPGATVSASFFDVLGVEAALGRTFHPDEEGEGREPVVVLGHDLWTREFGGDPGVLGETVVANGVPYMILGVLPPDFETPGLEGVSFAPPEIWRTVAAPSPYRSGRSWAALGRLRDGVELQAARAEVTSVYGALAADFPEENVGYGMDLVPLREQIVGDAATVLPLLLAAVALVLMIACANVAGLLMVRAVERRDELDLRAALGASRGRLAATALLESLLLAAGGAALGVALAWVGLPAARRWVEGVLPRTDAVAMDMGVLSFTLLVAGAAGLVCGAVPAWAALHRSGRAASRGGRGASSDRAATRSRRVLVVAEVALSVMLLVGGGVLLRSLDSLYAVDLGLERHGILAVELHSSAFVGLSPGEAEGRYRSILDGLEALPGVRATGGINIMPLTGGFSCDGVLAVGARAPHESGPCAEIRVVLPGALEALGVPLLRGRALDNTDGADAPGAMVVSDAMAGAFWPGEDPLGKRAEIHGATFEVVGVAGDMRHFGPAGEERPQVYLPAGQEPWGGFYYPFTLVLSVDGSPESLVPGVRRVLDEVDPGIAVTSIQTLDGLLHDLLARPRFQTAVLTGFASLAVILAMVGLAGMLAYSVRRRTREIGLRVALGAEPRAVAALVAREGAFLLGMGGTAGLLAALVLADVLSSMVFGVDVRDPWTIAATLGLLMVLGLAACWVPARRASRVDPVRVLGGE